MQESPLIGICDGTIDKNGTDYYTNKVGGYPDLIPGISYPVYRCILCDGILSHVVQIYCPLAASSYHRTLHVFACTTPQCFSKPESWLVIRSQCLDSELKQPTECKTAKTPVSTTDWCDQADDWGMEAENINDYRMTDTATAQSVTDDFKSSLDVSSRLHDLCIDGVRNTESDGTFKSGPTFQPYYISVVEETDFVGHKDVEHANRLLKEYEAREGVTVGETGCCEGDGGKEKYEKVEAKHGDTVFSNFMKRIALCPEQVLRYSRVGSPLFIADPPSKISEMVPPCALCRSPRVFEFQLMPALVNLLHNTESASELTVEFGTVLVYTCRDSCWMSGSTTAVKEFLFLQPDPDQKLFK